MVINLHWAVFSFLFITCAAQAGSIDGRSYTNFGNDLVRPIFPVGGKLAIYKDRNDANPRTTLRNKSVAELEGDWRSCVKTPPDGWVNCNVKGEKGWAKRTDFHSAGEYAPLEAWPFRWWLYVASDGNGGEEGDNMRSAARVNPYLIAPDAFDNIFFHVRFDGEGRALAPRSGKPTGDRVFVAGRAVYLAPADSTKRNGATWLFLNYYNQELKAMCPALHPDSCMSAVNTAPNWTGIKALYEEPAPQFRRKDGERWYGATEVAFARHLDLVVPLMYHVPAGVHMKIDANPIKDGQLAKNRQKPFCIADCPTSGYSDGQQAKHDNSVMQPAR